MSKGSKRRPNKRVLFRCMACDLFGANGLILVGGLVMLWFSGSDK